MPSPANTAPSVIFDLSVQYPVSLGCRAFSSGCGVRAFELNIEGLGFSAFSMGTFGCMPGRRLATGQADHQGSGIWRPKASHIWLFKHSGSMRLQSFGAFITGTLSLQVAYLQ